MTPAEVQEPAVETFNYFVAIRALRSLADQLEAAHAQALSSIEREDSAAAIRASERERILATLTDLRMNDGDGQHVQWYAGIDDSMRAIRELGDE